ncbi:MAG: LysR substrate-binding domain-containing protein [Aquabacterium sp.]
MALLPDLVSLALFLRACESRSLSKAAEQSHIALAAASRRIALLEARYRVQLLYRSSQGVEVTPAGKALALHARSMLQQAERLHADLSDYAKGLKGHIRIQANTSAITQFLPDDLASFGLNCPAVKIELEERRSSEIVDALHDGQADIGVVMAGTALDGLQHFDYRRDRLVAVVPQGHALQGPTVAFSELVQHPLVALDSSAAMMRLLADAASDGDQPLQLRVQVRSFEAVCRLVQVGMGIGVLPEAAARVFAAALGLRLVRLSDPWADRRMMVCVRNMDGLTAVARSLVDHLVNSAAAAPAQDAAPVWLEAA